MSKQAHKHRWSFSVDGERRIECWGHGRGCSVELSDAQVLRILNRRVPKYVKVGYLDPEGNPHIGLVPSNVRHPKRPPLYIRKERP